MTEPRPAIVEHLLNCGLCGLHYPASQMPMRGRLNFCKTCASERAAGCLARLDEAGKSPRRRSFLGALVASGIVAVALWWGANACRYRDALFFRNLPSIPGATGTGDEAPASDANEQPWYVRMFAGKRPSPAADAGQQKRSVVDAGQIHLLYVTQPGTDGRMGLTSRLFITREAPHMVSAKLMTEVGKDMQTSFAEGLRYVDKLPRAWEKEFSIRLSFEDKFTSKDGGSAGTGFTIGMLAAIQNIALDPDVAITGDLTVDGSVQPVGAVVEKLRGAVVGKCKITLIPERNSRDVVDLALLDGTSPLWETQVFSIGTVEQALAFARRDRAEKTRSAITRFNALRARLPATVTANYLQSPVVQTELAHVLADAPNHVSAMTLLRAAANQLPPELSLNRSVEEILAMSYLFVDGVINPEKKSRSGSGGKGLTVFPEREFAECQKSLQRLTPILDRRSLDLKSNCSAYVTSLRAAWNYHPPAADGFRTQQQWLDAVRRESGFQAQTQENLEDARSRLLLSLRKLDTDGSLMMELLKQ